MHHRELGDRRASARCSRRCRGSATRSRSAGASWVYDGPRDLLDGNAPEHALKTEFGEDFVNYQGIRTKYFDTYFRAVAADGVTQIVLLAAGLDSRGYRLNWPDDTVLFELGSL